MISFIILSTLFLFLLSDNFKSISDKKEVFISNIITSVMLSISSIGIISIGLIFFEKTRIPIVFFAVTVLFLYIIHKKINTQNMRNFLNSIKLIIDVFSRNFENSKFVILLMIWLYFISFGPINHPDSITTYVGYPYQFFLQNKHFIDGGLHQGILGLSDFANLSFIQENNIWLIRSIQSLPIILIVSIFLLRNINKILIITFLTCPVFIQWLTIGKYIFLPDIAITITYLVWTRAKEKNTVLNLIIVILLAISFKITCLVISIPIILHLFYDFFKNKQYILEKFELNFSKISFLILSIFSLFSIFTYRLYVTGNPFYPVLNKYFVPDNKQILDFENLLKGFFKGEGYPFNLLMTNDINYLAMIIGPATGFFLLFIPITNIIFSKKKYFSIPELIPIFQLILLLTISQGRADYFLSPIILSLMIKNNEIKGLFSKNNFLYLKIFSLKLASQFLLLIQIFIFLTITSISGYQTIYSAIDYDSYMRRYAYNYDITKSLNNFAKEPVIHLEGRTALLFLNKHYIHEDRYKKCINSYDNNNNTFDCIEILKPNSVISIDDPFYKKNFNCNEFSSKETSRNPFNLKKVIFHICNKSET